uniref:Ig-like domain-containing protein n=1 Tax=Sphaeramia orbicularis TaxID=375764 RepID=A0A673CI30_9TELE
MRGQIFIYFFTFLWTSAAGDDDTKVSCIFMRPCILPCSFRSGIEVIHWVKEPSNIQVYSYYDKSAQLSQQDVHFKGRTSLFGDTVSGGNASLQLREVEVQDEGRYKCYTRIGEDTKDSFISLKVDAPVDKVDIDEVENRIFCSSEGIYPKPELTWSISPSSTETEQNKPTVLQNDQKLYTISSYLMPLDNITDVKYSCNISTQNSWRRATLVTSDYFNRTDTEITIPCAAPHTSLTSFIWRFNQTHIIVNQTGQVSETWSQKVKVSASGSLTLKDLTPDQEGMYTCELTNDKEMYKNNVFLRIEGKKEKRESPDYLWIIGVVAMVVAVFAIAVIVLYKYCHTGRPREGVI